MDKFPGYIDLQVNGYLGVDFSSSTLSNEGVVYVCKELRRRGTAAFLPTIITASKETMKRNLRLLAELIEKENPYNMLLGIHMEGPFLSKIKGAFGAHPESEIRDADPGMFYEFLDAAKGHLKLLTMAAGIRNGEEVCRSAVEQGVRVSLGHHSAGHKAVHVLAETGATGLTHLGNGLPVKINRHENPIYAGLLEDRLKAMIITDGFHIPESFIRLILKVKGVKNTIIVSDSAPAAGMPPGQYRYFGTDVELKQSGRLMKLSTPYLAGSSYCMHECVEFMRKLDICTKNELRRMAFDNPLAFLGLEPSQLQLDTFVDTPIEYTR